MRRRDVTTVTTVETVKTVFLPSWWQSRWTVWVGSDTATQNPSASAWTARPRVLERPCCVCPAGWYSWYAVCRPWRVLYGWGRSGIVFERLHLLWRAVGLGRYPRLRCRWQERDYKRGEMRRKESGKGRGKYRASVFYTTHYCVTMTISWRWCWFQLHVIRWR